MVSRQKTGAVYTVTTAREFRLRGLGPGVTNRKAKACFSAAKNDRLQTNGYKLFKKGRLWASLIADFHPHVIKGLHAGLQQRFWATARARALQAWPTVPSPRKAALAEPSTGFFLGRRPQCQADDADAT